MHRKLSILSTTLVLGLLVAACGEDKATKPSGPGHAAAAHPDEGKVLEKLDVEKYTYIRTVRLGKEIWVSAPRFQVEVGDLVIVPEGMPMQNFESKELERTFETLYMVSGVQVMGAGSTPADSHGGMAGMPEGHPPMSGEPAPTPANPTGTPEQHMSTGRMNLKVEKAADGHTVAEIFSNKAELKDKPVIVRGKVVKFNTAIMGKNWLHVQDGTGEKGTHDITVTTQAQVAVGDTVLVRGKLMLDRDFGSGYKYALIIEDAEITVEK